MTKETKSTLGVITCIAIAICLVPFSTIIVFPFFENFSQEKRFERFINEQCIEGNEIAIGIRRKSTRYYGESDYKLVRAAIEGNEHAIKALKLDL